MAIREADIEPLRLSDEELADRIEQLAAEARQWRESHLEPDQENATDYYKGKKFGNEEAGRSQVVLTDVRDTVLSILPSLLRIFFNSERPVEFEPRTPDQAGVARQQTEGVSFVVAQDNPGFKVLQDVFKDALIRKIGIVKYWWEDIDEIQTEHFTGLDEQAVLALLAEPDVEVEIDVVREDPRTGRATFDLSAIRRLREGDGVGRVRLAAVPPEEFLFSPETTDLTLRDFPFLAHEREIPASKAIAMGIPKDVVDRHKGKFGTEKIRTGTGLRAARRIDDGSFVFSDSKPKSEAEVLITEAWIRIDSDGDGVAELRKVTTIGSDYEIVRNIMVSEAPFAVFCPDPEPHTLVGNSVAELVMDLQKIKSQIARGMLDSLSAHLHPEREIVEGEVNIQDIMNPEIGKPIRVNKPGMVRDIIIPFVGGEALPVMQFFEGIRKSRTGVEVGGAGLDADALRNVSKQGAASAFTAAQERIEMIARIFAETGMTKMYRGIARLLHKHQNQPRMIRLRGEFVPMDPRVWDITLDTRVNVALGQGTPESQIQTLAMLAQKQQELMEAGSPLVSNVEFRNTLARMVEIAGFANPNEFLKPWRPEDEEQLQQQLAQQPPPPDPQMELVKIEQARLEAEMAKDQQELALKREEMLLEDDRKRDEQAQKAAIEEFRIEAKHDADLADAAVKEKIAERRKDNQ